MKLQKTVDIFSTTGYHFGMIEDFLSQLGLSDKEITVYIAVLKKGKVLPADVAKLTGLNRSTVYSVASELKQRGVISEDLGGPMRYLVALPPEDLMQLVHKEQQLLDKKKKVVTEAIVELQALVDKPTYVLPKIVFISEDELEAYLYKQTEKWNTSIMHADNVWWGFQDHAFVEAFQAWIDWYWKQVPPNLSLKLLSNRSETEKSMKKRGYDRRVIRFWKEGEHFTSTVWINGEYVVMIVTREHPFYLVEIHDAVLAANLRGVFKGIWKSLG